MTTSRGLLARIRARLHKDERGFTMIEVLAAILIFGVLITGIASM
ncbi:MAG: type IV pilus modification PilV family protein, partial [Actinomycetota bacterium]